MNSRFGAIYVDVYSLKIYLHFTLALYKFMNGCQYWLYLLKALII